MKAHRHSSLSHSGTAGYGVSTPPHTPDAGKQKRQLLMLVEKKEKESLHILSQKTQVTEIGSSTLNTRIRSAAAPVEAALRVLWPLCRRWKVGGGCVCPDAR